MPSAVLDKALRDIEARDAMNDGIKLFEGRMRSFGSTLEMKLAGAAMIPAARALIEARLDRLWEQRAERDIPASAPEIVIGAGLHAAVYCATRVLSGKPRPLVLERSLRPGGIFAMSRQPSFYLNSTNRPGDPGIPGEVGALNYLPGAPLQPSMLSPGQYQDNADIAFIVRVTLAEYADVITSAAAGGVTTINGGDGCVVSLADGAEITTRRVIDARGLGNPKTSGGRPDGVQILSFPQFMATLDEPFPFRGLDSVAVIGSGDSARCTVEALLGIGPSRHMSVAGLDYVPAVDWYALRQPRDCQDWRARERGRYQGIGNYLPRRGEVGRQNAPGARSRARLNIFPEREQAVKTLNGVLVGSRVYSKVIACTGFTRPDFVPPSRLAGVFLGGANPLALSIGGSELGSGYYRIGAAADLPFTENERRAGLAQVPANQAAVFRLAPRTAALAMNLP